MTTRQTCWAIVDKSDGWARFWSLNKAQAVRQWARVQEAERFKDCELRRVRFENGTESDGYTTFARPVYPA